MPLDQSIITGQAPGVARALRRVMRALPTNPRCKICYSPFAGPGGRVVRAFGFGPSRKNPTFCTSCFEKLPYGGQDQEIAVLFADIRGYTTLTETRPPEEMLALLQRFYAAATEVLIKAEAVIDRLVADEVVALFVPYFIPAEQCVPKMVEAAEQLLRAVGYGSRDGPWCPLGVGLTAGTAFVGNIGSDGVKDYTALGDVVNVASRLQGQAAAGQILMSKAVYEVVSTRHPDAPRKEFELKGKAEPVEAWVVDLNSAPAAASV